MQLNKKLVQKRFSKQALEYDTYAAVQKHMAHSLLTLVSSSGRYHKILEIGCGTGYFTGLLANAFPNAEIKATDISAGMLSVAQQKLSRCTNVCFEVEDGEKLKTRETFDLIVSNAVFQWFNDYDKAFAGFKERLNKGGALMYATLGAGTFAELHTAFSAAALEIQSEQREIHGQKFITEHELQDIRSSLKLRGTTITEEFREYFSDVRSFLTAIKKIGANNAMASEVNYNRLLLTTMLRIYEQRFQDNRKVYATYQIFYGQECLE